MTQQTTVQPATDDPDTPEGRIKNMCSILRVGLVLEVVPTTDLGGYAIHFAHPITAGARAALDTSPLDILDAHEKIAIVKIPDDWGVSPASVATTATPEAATVPDLPTVQPGDGLPANDPTDDIGTLGGWTPGKPLPPRDSPFPVEDILTEMIAKLQMQLDEANAQIADQQTMIASQQEALIQMAQPYPRVPRKEFCITTGATEAELERRTNEGWTTYHMQFDHEKLNVVFMRIVEAPAAPDSTRAAAAVEAAVRTEQTVEAPAPAVRVPDAIVMPVNRATKLQAAMNNPLTRAIREKGADATIAEMNADVIAVGRAYFAAHRPQTPVRPPLLLTAAIPQAQS